MKRDYVKLTDNGVWHVGTKAIYAMCGRKMPSKYNEWGYPTGSTLPWTRVSKEPDGPVCKTCIKSLAAWERDYGGELCGE